MQISNNLQAILEALHEQLRQFYGARLVSLILYGSYARQTQRLDSDIDIMAVLTGKVNTIEEVMATSRQVAAISLEYNVVISCAFVSVDDYERQASHWLRSIMREGVVL